MSIKLGLLALLDFLPIDHDRQIAAKGGMSALVIVNFHPLSEAGTSLGSGLPTMQIVALVFAIAPEPLDEDVVEE